SIIALSSLLASPVAAFNFTPAPSSNLRLDTLGRVAFAGDFDGLSLFQYLEQNEDSYYTNGSQSLLSRFPNGAFASISLADAHIKAMCPYFINGELQGLVVGGNFTSVGGINSQGVANINVDTGEVTPLPGLSGKVAALYCDDDSGYVYVGGEFQGLNSTNAIIWTGQWTNMPFQGFNKPVTSIIKASNGNFIFGGAFDGLGNNSTGTKKNDTQVIPVASGQVTATNSIQRDGFGDPRNIICKTADSDGSGNTWLAADNSPATWQDNFRFGFQPSLLRLYNTKIEGRGTKTWRYTALPDTGIMNFTYINKDGERAYCDATCPLPEGNTTAQDFEFVNTIGMNGFRIDISDWYGPGAGLAGIELFQDDIYSYAISSFNEPQCDDVSPAAATATVTGPWLVSPSNANTNSDYLSIRVNDTISEQSAAGVSVQFKPNLEQSGNYSIKLYTPGCIQDNTCSFRGRVSVSANTGSDTPVTAELAQTNNYDKYDEIFNGFIDASSQPSLTLSPTAGQTPNLGYLVFVAQRVRFELIAASTGDLQGLFEYNPNQQTVDINKLDSSAINRAGQGLTNGAIVKELAIQGDDTFVGGNFTSDAFSNIFKISGGNATSLSQGGLNNEVMTFYHDDTRLFVGGNFTATRNGGTAGLNGIALYSINDDSWTALGSGVDGIVQSILPLPLNLTGDQPETCIAVSGLFSSVFAFSNNAAFDAQGFAIWVPSVSNWLHNTDFATISLQGRLDTMANVPNSSPFYSGSVSSQALAASGAVGLRDSDGLQLQQLPFRLHPTPSSQQASRKRAATINGLNVTGAATGLIYEENDLNYTIIAGNFNAQVDGTNITNILIVNGTDSVTGLHDELPSESTFVTVGIQDRNGAALLFAGGSVTGTVNNDNVNGLVIYDLRAAKLHDPQPEGLTANDNEAVVHAVAVQTNSADVYVAGDFESAGSLACPSVCVYSTDLNQWNRPGDGIGGSVSVMQWTTDTVLIMGGNMTSGSNRTTMVTYDTTSRVFTSFPGADAMPGPVTSLSAANADRTQFWAGGTALNGSAFLQKYDGSQWQSISHLLGENTVISALQVMPLTDDHDNNDLMEGNRALLVMGQLNVPNYGNASSALYDGRTFTPFIISSSSRNTGGIISHAFVQRDDFFTSDDGHLAVGFVVLIALAIALGLIALIVLAGIVAERWRRRRDGYMPANQNMMSGAGNMDRIRPEALFGTLSK
ncbi:hypothetical protein EJ05DRAFT_419255, partial [Pseudovirgaria hyperparasitica]